MKTHVLIAAVAIAFGTACNSSTSPIPASPDAVVPTTPISPVVAQSYRLSDVVTDEFRIPISDARVIVDHGPGLPDLDPATTRLTTTTAADGRYEVVFTAEQVKEYSPFAMIRVSARGFPGYAQLVNRGATDTVKDVRLLRSQQLELGHIQVFTIEPDSSLCDIPGIGIDPTRICNWFHVRRSESNGRSIIISFRSDSATIIPTLQIGNQPPGQGDIIFESCGASQEVAFQVGIPIGLAPLRTVADSNNQPRVEPCVQDWLF